MIACIGLCFNNISTVEHIHIHEVFCITGKSSPHSENRDMMNGSTFFAWIMITPFESLGKKVSYNERQVFTKEMDGQSHLCVPAG